MKFFLTLQQKIDILHEAYREPGTIKSTARKYNIDPVQIRRWKKKLSSLNLDSGVPKLTMISSKGRAKKTFHNGKTRMDAEYYDAIHSTFDAIRLSGRFVSVMMLTIELKRISGSLVPLHVLVQRVGRWLVSVGIVQRRITHVAQNTRYCEKVMKDFVEYINCQLRWGQYRQDCVVNIDETNIYFDMESGLTLADKGDKTVSLKTSGSSMRCTVLLGVTLNGEKLTPSVVFKKGSNGRIATNFAGMPASLVYVCQDKAWVDQRVFRY